MNSFLALLSLTIICTYADVPQMHLEMMWKKNADGTRVIRYGRSEFREKSMEAVAKIGEGTCRELNRYFISKLRADKIRARLCTVGRWYHKDDHHFFCQYYDPDKKCWIILDASDDKGLASVGPRERQASGEWNALTYYAYPEQTTKGVPTDLFHLSLWEYCIPITADLANTYQFQVVHPSLTEPAVLRACVWNSGLWRSIANVPLNPPAVPPQQEEQSSASFKFAEGAAQARPVLVTLTAGNTLLWGLKNPRKHEQPLTLACAVLDQCIMWEPADD